LLTLILFLFMQDWILGIAATAMYPFQGWIIPKLQRKVNQLGKQRVREMRRVAERIGETVGGATEIHAHNLARRRLAEYADRLGTVFDIRFEIYNRKFFVKFLNNFINQMTPFFFYAIGGYLVIMGELSFGALVAGLSAYKDMSSPWKELLNYYQQKEDVRIKFEQVVEQFAPPGMMEEAQQLAEPETIAPLGAQLRLGGVQFVEDGGSHQLDGVSLELDSRTHVAIVGPNGGGKDALGMVLARIVRPTAGQVFVDGVDMANLPEAVTGRRIAYVSASAYIFSASLRENLLLGVMHRPIGDPPLSDYVKKRLAESAAAANSVDPVDADWIDHEMAGAATPEELTARLVELLRQVELDGDVYHLGLAGTVDPEARPEIAGRLLDARALLRDRLGDPRYASLVERFDEARYNDNATLAENLLFGTPVGDALDIERLAENPYVRTVLDRQGLTNDLIEIGRRVAATMVELFADLPPGHEFFSQFSFISSDDLPEYRAILARIDRSGVERSGIEGLSEAERLRLLSLPFKLSEARHRLGLIDDALKSRILEARRVFRDGLPAELKGRIAFFQADAYNAATSVQDNILFGKLAYGYAQAGEQITRLIGEVLDQLELRPAVIEIGLDYQVGVAGARLTQAQRQKLALARCLIRRPDLLVVNEATAGLDSPAQSRVLDNVLKSREGKGVIWVLHRAGFATRFARVVVISGGHVVEQGAPAELAQKPGGHFARLLGEEN
jgi:ABC-type multidrug transport system fused ATPase/permease subunit